jgi:TonB family protein
MAHNPNPRPDSSEANELRRLSAVADPVSWSETELGTLMTEWRNTFSAQGAGALSADLALDLVLNKIVGLARESTHATAAAIALTRDGEIICRAASGDSAPDLGTRLSSDTGLSAACVQTGNWQRCDDSESDPRVDAELCRRLGVRSMLVVPVLKEGRLLGVLEVFSPQAQAFGERELETLRMITGSIVENVRLAAKLPLGAGGSQGAEVVNLHDENVNVAAEREVVSEVKGPEARTADFWTGALMVAVVALALTLGWMIGRAGRQRELVRGNGEGRPLLGVPNQVPAEAVKAPPSMAPTGSGGQLVVYQDGKVVFPRPTQPATMHTDIDASKTGVRPASGKVETTMAGPVRITPADAAKLITQRVEPEYPEAARERRAQGAVDLDALVGKDGVVEKFTAIRGDPDLAAAAATAVRQWKFQPYRSNGQVEAFQTRITVTFRLP